MPLYEYACLDCNERFEELRVTARADSPMPCTTCGSGRVKRLLSVFATRSSLAGAGRTMVASGGGCGCGGNCSCRN